MLWYRQAAEQGHIRAQFELAECYMQGKLVTNDSGHAADHVKAAYWRRLATEPRVDSAHLRAIRAMLQRLA